MSDKARISLNLILPEVPDERDACVARLRSRLDGVQGLSRGHVVTETDGPARLCLHYDPAVMSLADVERLARAAGAELHDGYGTPSWRFAPSRRRTPRRGSRSRCGPCPA